MASAPPPSAPRPGPLAELRRHPVLAALGIVLLGLAVLVAVWDWNWFRRPVEHIVERRTGRLFHIDGDLDVDLGWTPRIRADGLRFGNAPWAARPLMASARRLEFTVELGPLLRGDLRIPEVRLDRPALDLERGPGRVGNWVFGDRTDRDGPRFRRVWIDAGRLAYRDAAKGTDIHVDVSSDRPRRGEAAPPVVARGGGLWEGKPFTVQGRAESPLALRDTDSPYRIDATARAGATRARARGTLTDPLRLRGFDLRLSLEGDNLADLYPLLGIAFPATPAYAFDGRLTRAGARWRYDGFSGRVGRSDLSGDASVEVGGKRPYLRGDLVSKRLDLDDLAGFLGGSPTHGANARRGDRGASGRVLPDTPYNLARLRAMDADVKLRAHRIDAPGLPLDDMVAHLLLEDGLLRLDPLDFGVAGGHVRATVRMDAREAPIRTKAQVALRGLDLNRLLPGSPAMQDAVGRVGGEIALAGRGNSVAAMLATADGQVAIGMGRGEVSNLLLELAGLDVAEALKFLVTHDRKVPVRCAFGDFRVDGGIMQARALAFDTTDTIIVGEGRVDLRDETLALRLRPRPKDRSLFALRSPLLVGGTFRDPSFRPDLKRVGLRAGLALVLGSIAPPAALLATLELGPGEDSSCGGRYAK